MGKLSDAQLEGLRTKTVELLLALRASYLATGASPLKHWDQLQNRMLSAARRSATVDEWATMMARGLQLPAFSSSCSALLLSLSGAVREQGATAEWFGLVTREYGLLMAMTRLAADAARERKEKEGVL